MLSSSLFTSCQQDEVCDNITKLCRRRMKMDDIEQHLDQTNNFIILNEIKSFAPDKEKNRYFVLYYYHDEKQNEGILKVNKQGGLSILDRGFQPLAVQCRFSFENGILKMHGNLSSQPSPFK